MRAAMGSKIFISYRRDDTAGTAGRLHQYLEHALGKENLFIDVDDIPKGVNFRKALNDQLATCDIFLCVIGRNWLNDKDDEGRRRLDQAGDYVRVEIAEALKRNIRVIPVLVDGARLPKASELPDDIAQLTDRQCVELRNSHFKRDAAELADDIRGIANDKPFLASRKFRAAIVGAIVLLVVGIWIFFASMPRTTPDHLLAESSNDVRPIPPPVTPTNQRPEFCSQNSISPSDKILCGDQQLSSLDSNMESLFAKLKPSLAKDRRDHINALWTARQQCVDPNCIKQILSGEVDELNRWDKEISASK
jgi:hypothetical protein